MKITRSEEVVFLRLTESKDSYRALQGPKLIPLHHISQINQVWPPDCLQVEVWVEGQRMTVDETLEEIDLQLVDLGVLAPKRSIE